MITSENDFKPYENLANAIVKSAARDYRNSLKKLLINPNDYFALRSKEEAERFFFSEWYDVLTNLKPVYLMKRIQKEVGYCD